MESSASAGGVASAVLARVFAGWRTGLPGPVIVLQVGRAVNWLGTGLVLPFEIIYLRQARGFPTATFVVAATSHLRAFQARYLFDGATFAVFALVVLVGIPNPRLANAAPAAP